jgi:hypothetical protein
MLHWLASSTTPCSMQMQCLRCWSFVMLAAANVEWADEMSLAGAESASWVVEESVRVGSDAIIASSVRGAGRMRAARTCDHVTSAHFLRTFLQLCVACTK